MKPASRFFSLFATLGCSVLSASAATFYWDGGTVTVDGASAGGPGAWTIGAAGWEDGTNAQNWADNNDAVFGGTAGTLTLGGPITATSATFNTAGYIIDTNGNNSTWGTLAGSSGFTKQGVGTLTLSNTSSASGTVTITGGGVTLGNNSALGTSMVTLNGGTIERNAAGQTVTNAISVGASGGTILGRQTVDDYTTFSGQLTGSGPLTIQGLVTLNNNTNTFSGPVTISNTSSTYLRLSTNGVLPSSTDLTFGGSNSRLRLDGGVTQSFDSVSGTDGEVFMSGAGLSATIKIGNDGSSSSYGGTFSNNDGQLNLEKIGGGTLTLNRGAGNGAQINSVKVTGGKLVLDGASVAFDAGYFTGTQSYTVGTGAILEVNRAWNTRSANVYNINGGTLSFTAAASDTNYVNNLALTNGTVSGGEFRSGNNALATHTFAGDSGNTISSNVRLIKNGASQTVRFDVTNGAAANDLTVSGIIKDDASFTGSTVEKTGTGTMLVSNNNAYSGPTLISQGTLITTHNGGLGTAGTITLNSTSTAANATSLYAQVASSGDLVLSRAITVANQGTGTTTIGTNRTGAGRTFFNGLVTLNKNVTLSGMLTDRTQYRGGIRGTGNVTVSGGSRTTFSDSTADTEAAEGSALYDFTGNMNLTGTGTLLQFNSDIELTNAATVTVETGTTLRSAYGKTIRINALAGAGSVESVAGSGTLVVGIAGGGGNFSGVISGTGGDALKLTKTGAGNQTLSGSAANTYTGLTTVNAGTLTLDKNDGVTAIAGNISVTGTGTLATSAAKSGRIADTSNVTIDGSGASFQFGANQNETIAILAVNNGGTVSIGNTGSNLRPNGGITSTGGGSITMSTGGEGLNFNGAARTVTVSDNTLAISSPIVNGALNKAGNGTLALSGSNGYAGATAVNAGTLNIQSAGALGTTAAGTTVADGATLSIQGGIAVGNEALGLSGNGVSSGGALRNISGDNSYAGQVTLSANTRINSDSGTLTLGGPIIHGIGHNLTVGGAGDTTINGSITTTTGSLTKDGNGKLTLSQTNAFVGTTTISGGTLALSGAGTLASSAIIVGANTTFDVSALTGGFTVSSLQTISGTGNVVGNITVGGTLSPGNSPGDLSFADNLGLGGTLNLEITGTGAGLFDRLMGDTGNTLTLGGTLNLDNTGYSANLNDTVTVFGNWLSITGNFTTITGTDLGGGLSWDTSQLASSGVLTVVPEPGAALLGGLGVFALLRRRRVQ